MGVLNVTPDSFSDGGRFLSESDALRHAETLVREGTDIIDIGGESSRPAGPYGAGAKCVSIEEETRRTAPVIEAVARRFDTPISVDTVKSEVARAAIDAGASAVNDISGLDGDPRMLEVVASSGVSIFIMHMQGTPGTMQQAPRYRNLLRQISSYLKTGAERALSAGVSPDRVAIDPGLGFGKSYEDNYKIIAHLADFRDLGYPILIGPSRKTFVGIDFNLPPDQREEGSLAAFAMCAMAGANIIRVHDVQAARRALFVADNVRARSITAK